MSAQLGTFTVNPELLKFNSHDGQTVIITHFKDVNRYSASAHLYTRIIESAPFCLSAQFNAEEKEIGLLTYLTKDKVPWRAGPVQVNLLLVGPLNSQWITLRTPTEPLIALHTAFIDIINQQYPHPFIPENTLA